MITRSGAEEVQQARLSSGLAERLVRDVMECLDLLTVMHRMSRIEAAEKVGSSVLWYRRAVTAGLARIKRRTRKVLEKIVEVFGLTTVEDLWEPDLIRLERSGRMEAGADTPAHLVWRQKEWWPWPCKLAHILASGRHDYLKDMIDALYRTVPKDTFQEPESGAAYWSAGGDLEDTAESADSEDVAEYRARVSRRH